jgi:sulfopyruvate decarboxylase TPP-binding subunit
MGRGAMTETRITSDLVESIPASLLHAEISRLGVSHVLIVPDTHQKTLIASLQDDPKLQVLTFATEDEALCVGAGLWMGGVDALVQIQNVGLFAAMNALRGLCMDLRVPTCILVGQYGRDVTRPVPENGSSAVRLIESVLASMDVPCYVMDGPQDVGLLSRAFARSRAERRPTVVLVSAPTA